MSGPIVYQDKYLFQYINSYLSYKNIYDEVVEDIKDLGDIVKNIYREEGDSEWVYGPIIGCFHSVLASKIIKKMIAHIVGHKVVVLFM